MTTSAGACGPRGGPLGPTPIDLPRTSAHGRGHHIDQGADPLQVQRRLGHKDIRTTLRYYGHLFPNREDDLNEALERVYREARAGSLADSSRTEVVSLETVKAAT